ncbi:nucleoporin 153 isoform 2-T2 [Cochliomyia hominivorax]
MSEYAQDETSSPPRHENDSNLHNVSLEDAANNSIIGKVKSRVSSILPNRLSKWFSPSAKLHNDSLNGSICGANTTISARRRRRLEVEEEENYEDDEDIQENNHGIYSKQDQNRDRQIDVDDEDDSQNSDDEYNAERSLTNQQKGRDLNVEKQPPAKRSRLNTEIRDSPIISRHQPLLSSTPAVGSAYSRNSTTSTTLSRSSYQRFTNLNLYGNQIKKDPAFNFGSQKDIKSSSKINADIIDLISNTSYENEERAEPTNVYGGSRIGISSRKCLNIPSSTSTLSGVERVYASVANLKRQPLSTAKVDLSISNTSGVPPRRTSTTIQEVQDQEEAEYEQCEEKEKTEDVNANIYNGRIERSNNLGMNKRQKLINGTGLNATSMVVSNEAILLDSASESGESAMDVIKPSSSNTQQRKTGLFNMSTAGGARNSSRTSSFGNGLNFYSHLEGRKSLFSSSNQGMANTLNNSTLSLTSLNRRQFNASIYGSTSALSDSRLLNTFSPFYKGKTTYGGAAAYNKYIAGAGASAVRITPTLIRPTSSLSTVSSNNSLGNNINSQVGENSTISSTAKRILDLINDFATPLSEAKKMASSLKTNPNLQIPPQAKGRLNDSDLNASRVMRLSQVRTPYSRPAVILQPSGNASGRGAPGGLLPPVKELQVPTMSQLLQMKKMQNTTEKVRKIAQNSVENSGTSEYTLPDVAITNSSCNSVVEQDKQKHTNKIRNKIGTSLRPSAASKDLQDEEPPPRVNLPNIAFPLMQSVPKIDIPLNKPSAPKNTTIEFKTSQTTTITTTSNDTYKTDSLNTNSFAFNISPMKSSTQTTLVSRTDCKKPQLSTIQTTSNNANFDASPTTTTNTFKFSEPIPIDVVSTPINSLTKIDKDKYKFSPPLDVIVSSASYDNANKTHNTQPKQPQFKEGSCLDALKKPFSMPPAALKPNITGQEPSINNSPKPAIGFGNIFKKSSNEWECDACMIRNKSDVNKCVACETPRKQATLINHQPPTTTASGTSTFGQQFKKSSNEWECDACMIRNKEKVSKCVACDTPRKDASPQTISTLQPIKNSFGDAFKPKSGTWECQTCMISNKNEANVCIACQTKKPGASSTTSAGSLSTTQTTQFKFGFAAASTTASNVNANSNTDAGFKALAAQQKASKWECDACMTRNDANRTKCACCEQPKPGTTGEEANNSSSGKFQFGATAASKFSFGFGTGVNAPKEDDLRKQLSNKNEDTTKAPATTLVPTIQGGFQFGINPVTNNNTNENKKDEIDSNKQSTDFKFGVATAADETKVNKPSTTLPTATKSFVFGSTETTISTSTTSTSSSSAIAANTPSVKFTLPSPTTTSANVNNNNDKSRGVTAPTFGFGSTTTTSATSGGFSFGSKIESKSSTEAVDEKKTLDSFAFKTPTTISATTSIKSSGFVFGSSATNTSSTAATTVSSTKNTTATSATAAVKPMFSFGSTTSSTSTSQTTPAFGSFSFGGNSTTSNASTTTANTSIAAVTSTSSVTTTANATSSTTSLSTTTTTPASTNIFGSFGSGSGLSSNSSSTSIFGSSLVKPPASNNLTNVSSSTNNTTTNTNAPTFGAFGSSTNSNGFGSFATAGGSNNNSTLTKPNEAKPTLPVFGNVASSTSTQSSLSSSSGFVFGSSVSNNTTPLATTTGSVTSTSATWPKNSFVFGSPVASTSSTNFANQASSTSENKEIAKPSVFGTFGMTNTASNNQHQNSIFGAPTVGAASSGSSSLANSAPGSTNTSANLFGTNSTPAATSIFGASSSGNAATPTPAFGSSPFGGAASSTSATPTFGSTAASGTTTFSGFGATANNTITNTTEVKKPEAAFNFGAAPVTQSTSGGFNFGSSSATKPAFNFSGTTTTQQPSFNFTGTAEANTNTRSPNRTTGKEENTCTNTTSNTAVENIIKTNAFISGDRSQQNIHEQTGQNINSSCIIKKEKKHQYQHLPQPQKQEQKQNQQKDDIIFSKTDDNLRRVRNCTGINTVDVASNNRLSKDLQQEITMVSLKQKNKILLNKYKLIRKVSSLSTASSLSSSTNRYNVDDIIKEKEDLAKQLIVQNNVEGIRRQQQDQTAKRIIKFKTHATSPKKVKHNSTNYYCKINNNNNNNTGNSKNDTLVKEKIIATTADTHPSNTSVIFKSPRRKVHMIVSDTTNKFWESRRRYSLVVNKPNTSSVSSTETFNAPAIASIKTTTTEHS